MRRLTILFALAFVACDDPAPSAPDLTPDPDTEQPPEAPAEPPPLVDPAPDAVRFEVPEAADALPALESLETGRRVLSRSAAWSAPVHADPVVQRRLSMIFEHLAYQHAFTSHSEGDDGYWDNARPYGGCRPVVATARFVSVICYSSHIHRGGGVSNRFGGRAHLAIVGQQVIPFAFESAFSAGTDIAEVVDEQTCVEARTAAGAALGPAIRTCRPLVAQPEQWLLGPEGLVQSVGRAVDPDLEGVPYASIRAHLRPDGPMAWLFSAERPRLWVSEENADGFAITDVQPWPELVSLAAKLDDEQLTEVLAQDFEDQAARLVIAGADALPRARALAEVLGTEVRRARWDDSDERRLRRVRTTAASPLMTRTERGAARRIVPRGTHLVAVDFPDGREPEANDRARLVGGWELVGFAERAGFEADVGCRPDPSPFVATFDEARRPEVRQRLHIASPIVRTAPGEEPRPLAMFVGQANRETKLRLQEMSAACELGETLLDETLPGNFFDVRFGSSEPEGAGEVFLLLGLYRAERSRRYVAYRLSNRRRVLAENVETEQWLAGEPLRIVELGSGEGEDWLPLRLGDHYFRWTGRLVQRD